MASDETALETIFIALLSQDVTLLALGPKHHSDDTANSVKRLMVSAVKGEQRYDGVGGFDYEVRIEYCNHAVDAADVDDISNRIDATIEDPDITGIDLGAFYFLRIENAITGEREETDEARERVRTFPVIALASIPTGTLQREDGSSELREDGTPALTEG